MQGTVIDQLEQVADTLTQLDPHDLPDTLLLEWTARILRVQRRLDAAVCDQLLVIDTRDATTNEHACTTKAWLVEEQQLAPGNAARRLKVARTSVTRPAVLDAMRAGDATLDQAGLIVNFLPKLPDAQTRDVAEAELLKAAAYVDPSLLARGLRELTDRLCLNETAEGRAVRAREGRYLRFTDTINRMVRIDGMLPAAEASIVKKALYPLGLTLGADDARTHPQRHADALVELATLAMKSGNLPETAGEPTQCLVTTSLSDLVRRLIPGDTATSTLNGEPITPNTARMHACDAGIIPAVMGGASEVLDLGRSTRTWSRAQRRAAKLRAGATCEAPGCRAAIERCDLHHEDYWSQGGNTDLDKAIYICPYHHWLTHHTPWQITRNQQGRVEVRRT